MNVRIWAVMVVAASVALPAGAAALHSVPANGVQSSATTSVNDVQNSADKVHLHAGFAAPVAKDGTRKLVVHLRMAHGWHVNAHPASEKFLIATQLIARTGGNVVALKTDYPPGVDSGIKLGGTTIKVYDDDTRIDATLPAAAVAAAQAAGSLIVVLRVQACSDKGICLPPSRLDQRLKW